MLRHNQDVYLFIYIHSATYVSLDIPFTSYITSLHIKKFLTVHINNI